MPRKPKATEENNVPAKKTARKPREKKEVPTVTEEAAVKVAPAVEEIVLVKEPEVEVVLVAEEAAVAEEKKPESAARKPKTKKTADAPATKKAPSAKKAPAKKPAAKKQAEKKATAKKAPVIIIQSPMGGEITVDEIRNRLNNVEKVYVRVDQNKVHWVDGDNTGAIDIW